MTFFEASVAKINTMLMVDGMNLSTDEVCVHDYGNIMVTLTHT